MSVTSASSQLYCSILLEYQVDDAVKQLNLVTRVTKHVESIGKFHASKDVRSISCHVPGSTNNGIQ